MALGPGSWAQGTGSGSREEKECAGMSPSCRPAGTQPAGLPSARCPAVLQNTLCADVVGPTGCVWGGAPRGSHRPLIKVPKLLPQLLHGFPCWNIPEWVRSADSITVFLSWPGEGPGVGTGLGEAWGGASLSPSLSVTCGPGRALGRVGGGWASTMQTADRAGLALAAGRRGPSPPWEDTLVIGKPP